MKQILIDADGLLYKAALKGNMNITWSEEEGDTSNIIDFDKAKKKLLKVINNIEKQTQSTNRLFCLSDKRSNYFRNEIYPLYKSKRTSPKPVLLPVLKAWLQEHYAAYMIPTLEADDLLGIFSSESNTVQVSFDKDLKQIPGKFYDLTHDAMSTITREEADYNFFLQCLMGDSTDGYPGLPKVGIKGATRILDDDCSWEAVVRAYEGKGLTEEAALVQARVARILRPGEYNFKTKEVTLYAD